MPKKWSQSVGKRPHVVTVYERKPGGMIYLRWWDPSAGKAGSWRASSLGHDDRIIAIEQAATECKRLRRLGKTAAAPRRITVDLMLAEYLTYLRAKPDRRPLTKSEDNRRAELWVRFLSPQTDPRSVGKREWEAFKNQRRAGVIDSRGIPADPASNERVSLRVVQADLNWLRWAYRWAVTWRLSDGRYLLDQNPVAGKDFKPEPPAKVRRAVASSNRFHALRAEAADGGMCATDRLEMEVRWRGQREKQRSYLTELLDIANGTGRRLTPICRLRYSDLRLAATPEAPHGAIVWPEDTDKKDREWNAPITPHVRAAIDRVLADRPGVGIGYLFPAPTDQSRPISRHLADSWLRRAEVLADLPSQKGSLWHAYRRKWATDRKHLPAPDVAAAGGWANALTLQHCYQGADEKTILGVVMYGADDLETARTDTPEPIHKTKVAK